MLPERRILYPLTAAIVLAYFLFFTLPSLKLFFDQDDMMNLYRAWSMPQGQLLRANLFFWSDTFRPLGALFYRCLFAAAGFNPLPFRIACLALGAINIGLCFTFTKLIANSDRVAALTILLFAFHTRLMEVWFRTAVVYDLLSFSFFYFAACLYIQARQAGRYPSLRRSLAIVLFYIAALDSKEAAVVLPIVLCAFELLLMSRRLKDFRLPAVLGLFTVPYVMAKVNGSGVMKDNPSFQSEYSVTRFLHSWATFLNYLFVLTDGITPAIAAALLASLVLIAVLLRSGMLSFAWVLLVAGALPVCFLEYRGGYVLYISYVGGCMFAAMLLVRLQDLLPKYRTISACIVFAFVAWRFGKVNLHDQRADPRPWLYDPPRMVHRMADGMRSLQPELPKGAHLLFVDDPFSTDEWTPWFIVKLLYRDDSLTIDRTKMMQNKPGDWNGYSFVFTYDQARYKRLKP